mgnify:CR=1 FL=1
MMSDKDTIDSGEYLIAEPVQAVDNHKEKSTITKEQAELAPEIQRIAQEELQYVMSHLEEYEGLSQRGINGRVVHKVRQRCKSELGIEFEH